MLQRSNQLPKTLLKSDEERIKQRIHHVLFWLDKFAPASVKFQIQKMPPRIQLSEKQQAFLNTFLKDIVHISWDAETIHNQIYTIIENQDIEPKDAFSTIYQVILGQNKGPRIGYFLSNLEKDFVFSRFKEVVK